MVTTAPGQLRFSPGPEKLCRVGFADTGLGGFEKAEETEEEEFFLLVHVNVILHVASRAEVQNRWADFRDDRKGG